MATLPGVGERGSTPEMLIFYIHILIVLKMLKLNMKLIFIKKIRLFIKINNIDAVVPH